MELVRANKNSLSSFPYKGEASPFLRVYSTCCTAPLWRSPNAIFAIVVNRRRFCAKRDQAGKRRACTELSANLKAQGWTKEGGDLITPGSAMLKRKRGDAELRISVKPDGDGSGVKMMTEGLAWDEK